MLKLQNRESGQKFEAEIVEEETKLFKKSQIVDK
jgi:hypothetical protein